MSVYRTFGTLTDSIAYENVPAAQAYLKLDHEGKPLNMQQYLDPPLGGVIELLEWDLKGDGYNYDITATSKRELTQDELKQLSSEVSGQNSDGLGEGFEQQDFAWSEEDDCTCDGDGWGSCDCENGHMISFDWQTNELKWTRVG